LELEGEREKDDIVYRRYMTTTYARSASYDYDAHHLKESLLGEMLALWNERALAVVSR